MSRFAQTSNFDLHFALSTSDSRSVLIEDIRVPHHEIKAKSVLLELRRKKIQLNNLQLVLLQNCLPGSKRNYEFIIPLTIISRAAFKDFGKCRITVELLFACRLYPINDDYQSAHIFAAINVNYRTIIWFSKH